MTLNAWISSQIHWKAQICSPLIIILHVLSFSQIMYTFSPFFLHLTAREHCDCLVSHWDANSSNLAVAIVSTNEMVMRKKKHVFNKTVCKHHKYVIYKFIPNKVKKKKKAWSIKWEIQGTIRGKERRLTNWISLKLKNIYEPPF